MSIAVHFASLLLFLVLFTVLLKEQRKRRMLCLLLKGKSAKRVLLADPIRNFFDYCAIFKIPFQLHAKNTSKIAKIDLVLLYTLFCEFDLESARLEQREGHSCLFLKINCDPGQDFESRLQNYFALRIALEKC